jgi:hypothetical protein
LGLQKYNKFYKIERKFIAKFAIGGNLLLLARKSPYQGPQKYSKSINSTNKFEPASNMPFKVKSIPFLSFTLLLQLLLMPGYAIFAQTKLVFPPRPNYQNLASWAASPFKQDPSDLCPKQVKYPFNDTSIADVFFIHPTSFTEKTDSLHWNAAWDDPKQKEKTLKNAIKFQASVFNHVGRVYAPFYRQANIEIYYTNNLQKAFQAADTAYADVRNAFLYYLQNYNHGRPIIIASHSQGSTHAIWLLKEFFDTTDLKKQLVTAYIPGMTVRYSDFKTLKAAPDSNYVGGYCVWRSAEKGYYPPSLPRGKEVVCTNPISWNLDSTAVDKTFNKGAVLLPFNKVIPKATGAQISNSILWVQKPHFKGSKWIKNKNYHIADYNLFYLNVRDNAHLRLHNYLLNYAKNQ